jgi:hypothetical protein
MNYVSEKIRPTEPPNDNWQTCKQTALEVWKEAADV